MDKINDDMLQALLKLEQSGMKVVGGRMLPKYNRRKSQTMFSDLQPSDNQSQNEDTLRRNK